MPQIQNAYEQKKCIYCNSPITKRNGHKNGVQTYKCNACGRRFSAAESVPTERLWQEYLHGKQTYREIGQRYGMSDSTVKRRLKKVTEDWHAPKGEAEIFLNMDATYFGKGWGVLAGMDSASGCVLFRKYVDAESVGDYLECVSSVEGLGYKIKGVIVDGLTGLIKALGGRKVQMCQYHQCAIVRRYLTCRPKTEAGRELLALTWTLARSDRETFGRELRQWETRWSDFLKETTVDAATGKNRYVHRRLRSAFRSLKFHVPYLFTYQEEGCEGMPNTNNKIEGTFTKLKNALRNHNGMSRDNRERFIDGFFKACEDQRVP